MPREEPARARTAAAHLSGAHPQQRIIASAAASAGSALNSSSRIASGRLYTQQERHSK